MTAGAAGISVVSGLRRLACAGALLLLPGMVVAQSGKPPALPPGMADMTAPKTVPIPTTFNELFNERNTRALQALGYLRCLQTTLRAVQSGFLGPVPRAWLMTCVQQGTEWRGVFGELTNEESGYVVRKQFALRGSGMIVTEPIDTARAAGVTRAMLRGIAAPLPGKGRYEYMPVPLPQPTFIEVWFLPVPSEPASAVVGGDSLIQMNSAGVRELGHSRTSSPIRTISVSAGPSYAFKSLEERIPLLSELMVAHMALSLAPEVRVRTNQFESVYTRGSTLARHIPQ